MEKYKLNPTQKLLIVFGVHDKPSRILWFESCAFQHVETDS